MSDVRDLFQVLQIVASDRGEPVPEDLQAQLWALVSREQEFTEAVIAAAIQMVRDRPPPTDD